MNGNLFLCTKGAGKKNLGKGYSIEYRNGKVYLLKEGKEHYCQPAKEYDLYEVIKHRGMAPYIRQRECPKRVDKRLPWLLMYNHNNTATDPSKLPGIVKQECAKCKNRCEGCKPSCLRGENYIFYLCSDPQLATGFKSVAGWASGVQTKKEVLGLVPLMVGYYPARLVKKILNESFGITAEEYREAAEKKITI